MKYQVSIPDTGWVRGTQTDARGHSWLSLPRVTVYEDSGEDDALLAVSLIRTQHGVEVEGAKWVHPLPEGGVMEGEWVDTNEIELVGDGAYQYAPSDQEMTLDKAATAYGVKHDTLRKAIVEGRLTARKAGDRAWLVTHAAIRAYLNR